ncbi:MAG: DUF1254 domain-containing protein [Pseudomonadota bacterium]
MKRLLLTLALCVPTTVVAEDVNVANFVRAETDHMFRANLAAADLDVGEIGHEREPITAENQTVIRSNQDTLYSLAVVDLSEPAVFTLPEAGGRYMSMHVINQDHYMFVESAPGDYPLTEEKVGSRFAFILVRTFADVNDPEDVAAAHAAQDGLALTGGAPGPFEAPDWDLEALATAREAFNTLASLGTESRFAFGRRGETRPIDHLLGAASGWGGLPAQAAFYLLDSVDANDGETPHSVTVGEVPVGAFWSVTVYNADGYLEETELGRNSFNNVTAARNADDTITINFGGCDDGRVNCLPISQGWNYAIRMYEPDPMIIEGDWNFPAIEPRG